MDIEEVRKFDIFSWVKEMKGWRFSKNFSRGREKGKDVCLFYFFLGFFIMKFLF